MNILVTGANGYVGGHLLAYLTRQGHKALAVVRPECNAKDLEILRELGVALLHNDLEGYNRLSVKAGEVDAAIHLLGSIQRPAVGTFRSMHESKTRFLASECRRLGIKKLVYLGTLGAALNGVSEYLRTKWLAEEEVRSSGVDYVILRSPLIFGKSFGLRESKIIARLKDLIQNRRCIPILGNGKNLLQPIYIGDLVRCLEKATVDPALRDEQIDLGGPEILSFEQIVDTLAASLGIQKKKIKIPLPLAMVIACLFERLSSHPPITCDQVRMMRLDIVCQQDRMNQVFGPPRVRFKDGL